MREEREPQGFLDFGDLPRRWAQCDQVRESSRQAAASWDRRIVCPRSVDEGQIAGHRGYAAAERYLSIADENHGALLSLLEHHGATPTAPWNLLRPTFEASFYALWLLQPDDSLERRRRGVQLEWLDDEAARKYTAAAMSDSSVLAELGLDVATVQPDDRNNTQTYAEEADRLGLKYRDKDRRGKKVRPEPHRVIVEQSLPSLAPTDPMLALGLKTTWKTLSGIQHAEGSALLRVSDSASRGAYPGGERLLLTMNDAAFYTAAIATTVLRVLAWSRYGGCHRPIRSTAPVDLAPLRAIAARSLDAQ